MLPQAEGAALGMSLDQLRAARPRVIEDSHAIWEPGGVVGENAYWFSKPRFPGRAQLDACAGCRVSAVQMNLDTGDESEFARRKDTVYARWVGIAGTPTDTMRDSSRALGSNAFLPGTAFVWSLREVRLVLAFEDSSAGPNYAPGRMLRAIVQDKRLPLTVTWPFRGEGTSN